MTGRSVWSRVGRLETARMRRRGRCDACGWRDGDPVTFTCGPIGVIGEPPDPRDDPAMDTCRSCGRRLVLRIPSPRALPGGSLAG